MKFPANLQRAAVRWCNQWLARRLPECLALMAGTTLYLYWSLTR